MNWLDYVLLFILVYALFKGFRQGLVKQVVGLASFFIALYVALRWHRLARSFLDRYFKLDEVFAGPGAESTPVFLLVDVIINIIIFFIFLLLIYLILAVITKRLSIFNRIPIIGPLNALGGAVIGCIKGLLVIFLAVSLLSLLQTEYWQETLQNSAVVALSSHYIGLLFHFISGLVEANFSRLV